ncbi:hypothetical protein Tco_0991482 [Tanacetum coccineum]|uniref:Uncharacterized protein n=1 Tax=Tanacetum coccineum TaxID=301880 RepID=A0ABQ5EZE1_9ASTR
MEHSEGTNKREGSFSQISRVSTNPDSGYDENRNVSARVEGNRGISYVTQRRKAGVKIIHIQFRRISLTGFPAQCVRSYNTIALDLPYLLVLITGTSQSRQHESRKPPTTEFFDVDSGRISIVIVNTKEYHSDVLAVITRIMRRTLDNSL